MTRPRVVVFLCLAALVILGFFQFPGHHWIQQDTQIWVPMLEHIWDPAVLHGDIVAAKPHFAYTVFDETAIALRWISRSSFEAALVFEQLLFRLLELFGVYLLARSLPLSRNAALLVAALIGLGAFVAGPSVLTLEFEPVPRGFALGLMILALGLAARDKPMMGSCAAAIGFLYHPPAAIAVWIVFIALALWQRKYTLLVPLAGAGAILLLAARFQTGVAESQPFFSRIDPAWEGLMRMRASYNWVDSWINPLLWQYAMFWILSLLAVWRLRPAPIVRLFAIGLPLIGMLSVPVSYILTERVKWVLMPQVQPARALLWVIVFAIVLCAAAGIRAAERRVWSESTLWFTAVFVPPIEWKVFHISWEHVLLAVGLAAATYGLVAMNRTAAFAVAALIPYFAIPIIGGVQNYPRLHTKELDALVDFARTSTSRNAMFLFPDAGMELYPGIFRASAIRPVYVDWKSGGQVNYFRSLAFDWWRRWQATMSGRDIASAVPHFRELGIEYLVLKRDHPLANLTPVYSNDRYVAYKIR